MKVEFKRTFLKELKKIKSQRLKDSITRSIIQVESSSTVKQIKNIKKLVGYEIYYRIRVGDYRIGIKIENEVVYFVVFEHRKDIYQKFP